MNTRQTLLEAAENAFDMVTRQRGGFLPTAPAELKDKRRRDEGKS